MSIVAFYVTAHQDDWQLFRGQQAWTDIRSGHRIVFVYLTAGDAGRTDGWWEVRELGALESCRLATGRTPLRWAVRWFNRHPVATCDCANTTSYFLRLPDGSLQTIRARDWEVRTVDGAARYAGWGDVCTTLGEILKHERAAGQAHPWVNTHDFDPVLNPKDHPDHYATGHAVQEVTRGLYRRAWWVGYDVRHRAANLTPAETDLKLSLQRAYTDRILRETTAGGKPYDDWNAEGRIYERWLDKNYCRFDSGG